MIKRLIFAFLIHFLIGEIQANTQRVGSMLLPLDMLSSFTDNIEQFRQCFDQSFAKVVGEMNERQLQPLVMALSENFGRAFKAFETLTAPGSTKGPPSKPK